MRVETRQTDEISETEAALNFRVAPAHLGLSPVFRLHWAPPPSGAQDEVFQILQHISNLS